ncbi:unnamed protein product [Durusdinium trenchii]|uniref:30S ribosomal protein S10 n=2 Tax=Durusdinium trenchii TaxID=1381693 RepID=A0ABP0P425_9DINO
MSPKMLKLVINKSPNGHKKAKYKQTIIEYNWRIDYYPPKEGGLEAARIQVVTADCRCSFLNQYLR